MTNPSCPAGQALKPHGLSDQYWNRLSPEDQALYLVVRPLPRVSYSVDVPFGALEAFLSKQRDCIEAEGGSFELEPDFQRGHVWTPEQQACYMESVLRGAAPGKILFNCPGWERDLDVESDIAPNTFQCIDGLQRLTATRLFLAGQIEVFGGLSAHDLKGGPFDPGRRYCRPIGIYEFGKRADLLQFYLDVNGGTAHAQSELDRVRTLRDQALQAPEMVERSRAG